MALKRKAVVPSSSKQHPPSDSSSNDQPSKRVRLEKEHRSAHGSDNKKNLPSKEGGKKSEDKKNETEGKQEYKNDIWNDR